MALLSDVSLWARDVHLNGASLGSHVNPHPYDRKLIVVQERCLVESVCSPCGFRIVGSATEKLQQDEADHAAKCSGAAKAATAIG